MTARTIVLGGGISGLAVAHFLEGPSIVLEGDDRVGGLCRSYSKDGFIYDLGGHILFSKNETVLGEMRSWLGDGAATRRRANDIWYRDRFVKYPFENGLAALDKQEAYEILMAYLRCTNRPAKSLGDWCVERFGTGLAEKYLLPYNQKIWKRDPFQMSVHWVDRIPSPPLEDVVKSAIGIETEGYSFQLNFTYPREGGFESVIRGLAARVPGIRTGFRVTSIRKRGNEWLVSNGDETIAGDRLISTIPVFDLIPCIENVPSQVQRAVDDLVYNSLLVHMIAVKHDGLSGKTATYIPDPAVLPHRVCYMKGFSEFTAPQGSSHVLTETTARPGSPILTEDNDLVTERIINQIKGICGFDAADVCATDVRKVRYAYPVYDLEYQSKIDLLYRFLDDAGIHFTGRFAAYRYINSDKCVEFARALALQLNANEPVHRAWDHV